MSLIEELAEARARLKPPTDAELIESARWMVDHPDSSNSMRPILRALLAEIDRLKIRCRALSKLKVV